MIYEALVELPLDVKKAHGRMILCRAMIRERLSHARMLRDRGAPKSMVARPVRAAAVWRMELWKTQRQLVD